MKFTRPGVAAGAVLTVALVGGAGGAALLAHDEPSTGVVTIDRTGAETTTIDPSATPSAPAAPEFGAGDTGTMTTTKLTTAAPAADPAPARPAPVKRRGPNGEDDRAALVPEPAVTPAASPAPAAPAVTPPSPAAKPLVTFSPEPKTTSGPDKSVGVAPPAGADSPEAGDPPADGPNQ